MKVYLNGKFLPIESAHISPLDRGFLFGDGVYEVIPVFRRRPFALSLHLARLQRSLEGIRLSNPHTDEVWRQIIQETINIGDSEDQGLYVQITRGAYSKRDHAFPEKITPTIFLAPFAFPNIAEEAKTRGLSASSAVDNRWHLCHIKSTAILGNLLLRDDSVRAGADETILFRDGFLSESSAANIYVVKNGQLLIVPNDHHILTGCTYEVIRSLCITHCIAHAVRPITREEVFNADEILISSALKMILPITTLDHRPVGNGAPGAMFKRLHALIWAYQKAEQEKGGT